MYVFRSDLGRIGCVHMETALLGRCYQLWFGGGGFGLCGGLVAGHWVGRGAEFDRCSRTDLPIYLDFICGGCCQRNGTCTWSENEST